MAGYRFIPAAIDNGAAAVISDAAQAAPEINRPALAVTALEQHLGALAHEWYGRPSDELTIIAVTGTNGKTSATNWIAEALNIYGVYWASIGTFGVCLTLGVCHVPLF